MNRIDCLHRMRVALLVFCLIGPPQSFAADIVSFAFVEDDGSLRVRGRSIQLFGIHIPPTGRTCRSFERPPTCGSRALLALDFKIGSRFVRCEPQQQNPDRTITAICRVDGEDLGAYLLERGWALALPDAPFEYQALEKIARHKSFGVWGIPLGESGGRR